MKNSPAAAAAGLKIDMAAYIIDAAVCPSMQAAAVAIHKRLCLLCRAFYRIRGRIVDSLTG